VDLNRLASVFNVLVQMFKSLGSDVRVEMSRTDADSLVAEKATNQPSTFILSGDSDFLFVPGVNLVDLNSIEFPSCRSTQKMLHGRALTPSRAKCLPLCTSTRSKLARTILEFFGIS